MDPGLFQFDRHAQAAGTGTDDNDLSSIFVV
jgi:hypothetical protein